MSRTKLAVTDEEIRDHIDHCVAIGFDPMDEIIDSTVEVYSDDRPGENLRATVEAMARESLRAHLEAQGMWPTVTDCDLLDLAFADLEAGGIIARQNFSCCSTCGCAEIGDEIERAICQGERVRGYTFYHMQDADGAADGGGLYLNYGSIEEGTAAALEIGRAIVTVLNGRGLATDWDGTWNRRIWVGLDWKRRR